MEEYSNAAGGTVPLLGGQQAALPPIVMPSKKDKMGKHHHHVKGKGTMGGASTNIAAFNTTKKQFPQLSKLNAHKKNSYVSPYSIKTISKP